MIRRSITFAALVIQLLFNHSAFSQKVNEPKSSNKEWSQPYKPFRIVGNVYYVGTYDLACYLIVTTKGSILINTGLAASGSMIKSNIEALGFKLTDVKILLTTQAHYDHVGSMSEIKKLSGAEMWVDDKDADVLADGGSSDYEWGKNGMSFGPVKIDKRLKDGDVIRLGDTKLTMLHHPGHTKGSCSYLFDVNDNGKTYKVFIANMPTIITSEKLSNVTLYPDIAKDYAHTFDVMKKVEFDLWLSSHAGQFNLHSKHKHDDTYNPEVFRDRKGYDAALNDLEAGYRKKLDDK